MSEDVLEINEVAVKPQQIWEYPWIPKKIN